MQEIQKQSTTFTISEEFLKKTKKTYLYMLISMPLGIVAATFLITDWDQPYILNILIPVMAAVVVFLEIEILIIGKVMVSKIKKNRLVIDEQGVQRISGKSEQPVSFADLKEIVIRREKDSSIRFIKLTSVSNKKITIFGFEHMDQIAAHLTSHASAAAVTEKTYRYNYNSGGAYALIFCATLLACLFLFRQVGMEVYYVFMIGLGVWFLVFKPISRAQGTRFRLFELICGGLIVVAALLLLLLEFL